MIEDLTDIGAEALVTTAEAVAISKVNPDTETPELKKKKKHGLISAIFMIILMTGLVYIIFWRWDVFGDVGVDATGIVAALIAFGIALSAMFIMGIGSYIKHRNKDIKKIYVFIGLSGICTAAITIGIYPSMNFSNLMQVIPLIGFTFGITLMFFMLFHKMSDVTLNQFLEFPYHLLIRFFIPMMFICFLVLGALQGKYGYDSVFLQEVESNLVGGLGDIFGVAIYGVVEIIFNMAASRPNLFLFISGAVTLYLLYSTIRYAFWKERWPFNQEGYEENEDAQYFLDCADDKFLSKEDLESFKKGKLRLNKNHLNEYKEVKNE